MRVLVVEDESKMAALIERGLTRRGCLCTPATTGEQALLRLREESFDVVVLDWMLPGITGLDVVARMRRRGDDTPVLLLTARDSVPDKVAGLRAGADDHLVKPFAFSELDARLHALLRRARPPAHDEEPARLRIDPRTRTATLDGREVALSPRELSLLEALHRNQGVVLNRHQLAELAWPDAPDIEPNTVNAYIRYLRQKLGGDVIQTVRGTGYTLRW